MNYATFRAHIRLAILFSAVLVASAPALHSQDDDSDKATHVALGAVSGTAKSQVMLPVFLTPYPAETPVGSVTADIAYTDKGILFQRAEKSFLLDGVNGGFTAKAEKDPKDPEKSIVHIEVSTKGEPRKSLREGLILTLVFRIETEAPAGKTVALEVRKADVMNLDSPPKAVQPLVRKNGSIEVVAPEGLPYTGCFFFSH